MPVSNNRIQLDATWSIKVADFSDDFNTLFDLVKHGIENCGEVDIDWDFAFSVAKEYYVGPMSERVFLVLYKDLKPVGILLGAKVDLHPVFHKTGVTVEQVWFVEPDSRGNKVALKLVEAFEEWSRQLGVKRVVMGHFNDPVGSKIKKYYEKSGYKLLEESYVKVLV